MNHQRSHYHQQNQKTHCFSTESKSSGRRTTPVRSSSRLPHPRPWSRLMKRGVERKSSHLTLHVTHNAQSHIVSGISHPTHHAAHAARLRTPVLHVDDQSIAGNIPRTSMSRVTRHTQRARCYLNHCSLVGSSPAGVKQYLGCSIKMQHV